MDLVAFKQHKIGGLRSSFGGIGHSTDKFGGGHSVSWSAVKIGGHYPATNTRTTPRRVKFGGQVNVKCGGHVNVKLGHSGCAVEAEVAVCVVLRQL